MHKERGEGVDIFVILIGVAALIFVLSFFKTAPDFWDSIHFKKILRVPCGLTVQEPDFSKGEKAVFPLETSGYINECGWDAKGTSAGTVQIFDGKGLAVTAPTDMKTTSTNTPEYFDVMLKLTNSPTTDTGTILFKSTTGLLHAVPVSF